MRPEENNRQKRRSRRRRKSRGREIFNRFILFLFILVLIAGLTAGGVFGYRYWEGIQTSSLPLETSREVVPETMWKLY